jgi:hypothetical protein
VPLFDTMLMTVPPVLPNSALKKLVWTFSSSTTSEVGVYFTSVMPPFCSMEVSAPPSISTSAELLRTPLEMNETPPVEPTIPGASKTSESGLRPLFGTD